MVAGVYGELSSDGRHVVIAVSAEDDFELDRAGGVLRRLTPLLKPTEPKSGMLLCPLTWAAVTQLGHSFTGDYTGVWCPGPRLSEWIVEEFTRRHTLPGTAQSLLLPEGLTPRPYQIEGARAIGNSNGFLLLDEPGVGKTVTTLLGLLERQARGGKVFPLLIIAPSWDVCDVWSRHIADWAPSWPEPVMYGGPGRVTGADILITTYATARLDMNQLAALKPAVLVCDECHFLKNEGSLQSKAVRRIARHAMFLGLSGTPVTKNTADIYPALVAMDPSSYPSRKRFIQRYCDAIEDEYSVKIQGLNAAAEPEFRCALAGQTRRVAKSDVLAQLPPKIYSVRRVEVPPEWRKAYDGMAGDMLADLPDDGGELPVMSTLAQLTRLSQLASSACDVTVTEKPDDVTGELRKHYEVRLKTPCWKSDALLEVLAERKGQQVAVFANSRQLIDISGEACEAAGYRCGYITGGQGKTARRDDIAQFQDHKLDVILCTAGAGSLGITLTAAGTAVFLQRSWELDKALQPEDRLHRIGQENDCVEIIDIVAKNTVDDRVRQLLHVKGGHLGQLVQDPRIVRELLGGIK